MEGAEVLPAVLGPGAFSAGRIMAVLLTWYPALEGNPGAAGPGFASVVVAGT